MEYLHFHSLPSCADGFTPLCPQPESVPSCGTNRNAKFELVWASHASGFTNQKAGRASQGYIVRSDLTGVHWLLWH